MSYHHYLKQVLDAMQEAEEIGGPEGRDYDLLMASICDEATQRRRAYRASLPAAERKILGPMKKTRAQRSR